MKTVCKKLLCLMLVAMMLVSAVPAAFAADGMYTIVMDLYVDGQKETEKPVSVPENTVMDEGTIKLYAEQHLYGEYFNNDAYEYDGVGEQITVTADGQRTSISFNRVTPPCEHPDDKLTFVEDTATCDEDGVKKYTCECGEEVEKPSAKKGHQYDAGVVGPEPTCTEKGVKTFTCGECGDTYTEDVDALGHDRDDDGVCEVCGDGSENAFTLTFKYLDEDGNWTQETDVVNVGDEIEFPNVPNVSTKDFQDKWKGGDGKYYYDGDDWYGGMTQTFTAQYKSNTTADGIVELEVWAYYYVDGEYHHREELYTKNFEQSKKNTMFTWLYSDEGMDTTAAELEAEGYKGYEWTNLKYYNHYGDNEITEASMKSDGQKSVYIKVESTDEIEAEVMLYVHTKKSSTVDRVIPMDGYTEGDKVTRSDMKAAVKTKYSGSNMSISDMYTDSAWEDLLDGLESSGAESVEIKHNGTTKIHVIVKNASTSSKADSSNPKTGDYITIAVTTMALAAAGLVSIIELKKRKMI